MRRIDPVRILLAFVLSVAVILVIAANTTVERVGIQACSAEDRATKGSFGSACDGTYPAACGSGTGNDLLRCDDGGEETWDADQNGYAGVRTTDYNSSIANCTSVQRVYVCYEWWADSADTDDCDISVDNDGDGTWNAVTASCPGTTTEPGVTCTEVTSTENWTCGNFFGSSGTRAKIKSEVSKSTQQGGPATISWDVLRYNVTYQLPDQTPPNVTLDSPANDTFDLDGNVTFTYTPEDNRNLSSCTLRFDDQENATDNDPVNGTQNEFNLSDIPDGPHTWQVTCLDGNSNQGNSSTYNITIDTKPPAINLEQPANDTVSQTSDVTFSFNASDAQTGLDSCELIIDDSPRATNTSPAEDTTLEFTTSLTNGNHTWGGNCTDSNGFENASVRRNITINVSDPIVTTDANTYELGDAVSATAENFDASTELTFNYTYSDGTTTVNTETTDPNGVANDTLLLNYSDPTGTYNLITYQTSDASKNDTASFTVELPPTTVSTDKERYPQGAAVTVSGTDYSPNSTVEVLFTFSDDTTDKFTTETDSNGAFTTVRNLSYAAPLGRTNVTATDQTYPRLNATASFNITERNATVLTEKFLYARNEDVNISGLNFTRSDTVEYAIYDNDTGDIGPSFPENVSTNNTGDFATFWNTTDTCNGIYTVNATDNTNSQLNDTAVFNISEINTTRSNTSPSRGKKSTDGSSVDLSAINVSDDVDDTITASGGNGQVFYWEINYTNSFAEGIQIQEVNWTLEHAEDADLDSPTLLWYNGSGYQEVPCADLDTSGTDVTDRCDLSDEITNRTEANQVSLRYQLTKNTGGAQTSFIDFTQLEFKTGFQPLCTYFNGSTGGGIAEGQPVVTGVTVDDDISSPDNEIDLNAGTRRTVLCNVSVEDSEGAGDINLVNATFFSNSVSADAPDDDTNHYTNESCSQEQAAGDSAVYHCNVSVSYYAENNTWTCRAETTDGESTDSDTDGVTVNPLFALNVSESVIDYGEVQQNATSAEQKVNVTNIGNTRFNLSVLGYGGNDSQSGSGFAMECPNNNISIENERYALTPGVAFTDKENLSSTYEDSGLSVESLATTQQNENSTFWQLFIPSLEPSLQWGNTCNGTVVFQADPP